MDIWCRTSLGNALRVRRRPSRGRLSAAAGRRRRRPGLVQGHSETFSAESRLSALTAAISGSSFLACFNQIVPINNSISRPRGAGSFVLFYKIRVCQDLIIKLSTGIVIGILQLFSYWIITDNAILVCNRLASFLEFQTGVRKIKTRLNKRPAGTSWCRVVSQ